MLAQIDCHSPDNEEHRDYVAVQGWAWQHRPRIGDTPLTVISNRYSPPYDDYEDRTNLADQRGWFVLSPNARQVVVTSGHDVEENRHALVPTRRTQLPHSAAAETRPQAGPVGSTATVPNRSGGTDGARQARD